LQKSCLAGTPVRLSILEDHGKVIEKTLPGQSLECRGVLGIVPFGGDKGNRTLVRILAGSEGAIFEYC